MIDKETLATLPMFKTTPLIVSEVWMLSLREKVKSAHFRLTSCGVVGLSDSSDNMIKQTAKELETVLKEIDAIWLKKEQQDTNNA